MIAAVRAVDERGPSTSLLPGLLQALGIESFDLIMHRLYLQGLSRMEIAALAPLVLDIAMQGDPVALDILRQAVKEITLLVEVAARRLGFSAEDLRVTFSGGIVRSSALYRSVLYAESAALPGVTIIEPIYCRFTAPPCWRANSGARHRPRNSGKSGKCNWIRSLSDGFSNWQANVYV
jgi:N-acetylglucosamine kinase-like BadF-type ATPase